LITVAAMKDRHTRTQIKKAARELLFDPTPPFYAYEASGLDDPFAFRA
jgi:hypothetical protein